MLTPRRAKTILVLLLLTTGIVAFLSSPVPPSLPKVFAAMVITLTGPLGSSSPLHAHVGQVVTFTATGTTAADGTTCSVTGAPANVVTTVISQVSGGTGYGAFTIGPGPAGLGGAGYPLTIKCGTDTGTDTLIIDPFMTVTPSFGFASTKVVLTVNGFPSDALGPCTLSGAFLEVYANPSNPLNPTCTLSGSTGTVTGSFVANTGFPGANTVTVNVVGGTASASFTEVAAPTALLSLSDAPAKYGTIGGPITFTGGGFNLGSPRACTLTDSAPPLFSVSSPPCSINGNGTLTGSFAINAGAVGAGHTISVFDASTPACTPAPGCTPFTTTFTVDASPTTLGISGLAHGVAGTFFTISGPVVPFAGSKPGDAGSCNAIFSNPSSPVLLSSQFCVINNGGSILLASFRVAGTAPRDVIYTLQITPKQGDTSGLSVTFHSDPAISVSPGSGSPATGPFAATTVTISGTGFASTDTQLVCQGNTATTAPAGMFVSNYVCSSISGGILSATFQVGAGSLDKGAFRYDVTVNPGGGEATTATASFGVAPQIFASPSSGVGGNSILGGGAGFSGAFGPPCPLYVSSPNGLFASSPAASCSINAAGVATFAFTVDPVSLNGLYTITVGNGTHPHDSASFSPFTRGTVTTGNVFLSPNFGGLDTTVIVTGSSFSTSDNGCTITSLPILPTASPAACTMASGNVNGVFTINGQPSPGITLIQVTGTINGVNNDFGVAYFSVPYLVLTTVTSTSTSSALTSTSFSTLTTTTNFFSTLTTTTLSTTARSTETDIAYTYLTVTGEATNFLTMLETATSTSTFISTTMVTTTVASSTITVTVSGFVVRAQQYVGTPDGLGILAVLLLFVPLVVRRFYD